MEGSWAMNLPNQIRAVACVAWVTVLGVGQYSAREAVSSSRAGVIRAGIEGRTPPSILSGQDPQARLRNEQGTTPESLAATAGSPGFAQYRLMPRDQDLPESRVAKRLESAIAPSDGSARGVRHVPAPESTLLELERNPVPGSYHPYEVTAYSHGCTLPRIGPERPPQRAANGRWPVADLTVAADTRLHPFGTELLVEGLGFRTVGDRGHAIKGRRLDLFLDSCREAVRFGRRWLKVHLVPAATSLQAAQ